MPTVIFLNEKAIHRWALRQRLFSVSHSFSQNICFNEYRMEVKATRRWVILIVFRSYEQTFLLGFSSTLFDLL